MAEPLFLEALSHQRQHGEPFERARTELAYGESLRRARRRTEARTQLRDALATFEALNTPLWADRARAELEATGITARKRYLSTLDTLTPQELRIARLVGGGASNRDVAAQLFLSPKTVEYHLRKVFLKLGVFLALRARAPAAADRGRRRDGLEKKGGGGGREGERLGMASTTAERLRSWVDAVCWRRASMIRVAAAARSTAPAALSNAMCMALTNAVCAWSRWIRPSWEAAA